MSEHSQVPAPPFDPDLAAALAVLHEQVPVLNPGTLRGLPALGDVRAAMTGPEASDEELGRGGEYTVRELFAPGLDGGPEVPLVICRPAAAAAPVAALYYLHGGGMVLGNHRGPATAEALGWAAELGVALVSAGYRLAPEHPYPAAVEDCYAGFVHLNRHADELGIDAGRVVVAGTSAGGGLAAAVALLARDRGGPAPAGQMLLSPMLDDRNDTPSAHQMTGLGIWDRRFNELCWTALLGERRGGAAVSPYAAPARADDLSGLPPALLDVGSAETFRDEVVTYASRLWRAGGQAELHVWPGCFHGFQALVPQAPISRMATAVYVPWLRRVLRL